MLHIDTLETASLVQMPLNSISLRGSGDCIRRKVDKTQLAELLAYCWDPDSPYLSQ